MGAIKKLIDYSGGVSLAGPARAELAELHKLAVHSSDEGTHFYYKDAWEADQGLLAEKDAQIKRLTKEKQDEFEIASGYYRRLQAARARIVMLTTFIETISLAPTPEDPQARVEGIVARARLVLSGTPTTAKLVPVGILRKLNVLVAESLVSGGSYFSHEEREEVKRWLAAALREEKA
jgi:hypothetical protein